MLETLEKSLSEYALLNRGVFNASNNELAESSATFDAQSIVMVGVAGSAFWPVFKKSQEFLDGEVDPLDRWSKRIGDLIANEFSVQAVFPFEGPPYHPFIAWAKRCETVHSSKMGFSIHPEYGLWHAFRFALLFPTKQQNLKAKISNENPCLNCADSPCLTHCPVNAYSEKGFDADECFDYLHQNEQGECRTQGCIARRSCPEGAEFRYIPEHAEFHMNAFYDSQKLRRDNKS